MSNTTVFNQHGQAVTPATATPDADGVLRLRDRDGHMIPSYDWPPEFLGEPFEPTDEDRQAAAEMFGRPVPSDIPSLAASLVAWMTSLGLEPSAPSDRPHDSLLFVEVGGRTVEVQLTDLDAMADALAPDAPDDHMSRSAALGRVIATGRCETDEARLDRRLADLRESADADRLDRRLAELMAEFPARLPIDDAIAAGWMMQEDDQPPVNGYE